MVAIGCWGQPKITSAISRRKLKHGIVLIRAGEKLSGVVLLVVACTHVFPRKSNSRIKEAPFTPKAWGVSISQAGAYTHMDQREYEANNGK